MVVRKGEIVVAHGCRKRKMLICSTEGEIVVAHGGLPSPAPLASNWACLHKDNISPWYSVTAVAHNQLGLGRGTVYYWAGTLNNWAGTLYN